MGHALHGAHLWRMEGRGGEEALGHYHWQWRGEGGKKGVGEKGKAREERQEEGGKGLEGGGCR